MMWRVQHMSVITNACADPNFLRNVYTMSDALPGWMVFLKEMVCMLLLAHALLLASFKMFMGRHFFLID